MAQELQAGASSPLSLCVTASEIPPRGWERQGSCPKQKRHQTTQHCKRHLAALSSLSCEGRESQGEPGQLMLLGLRLTQHRDPSALTRYDVFLVWGHWHHPFSPCHSSWWWLLVS